MQLRSIEKTVRSPQGGEQSPLDSAQAHVDLVVLTAFQMPESMTPAAHRFPQHDNSAPSEPFHKTALGPYRPDETSNQYLSLSAVQSLTSLRFALCVPMESSGSRTFRETAA
jgi:hypothetical protein